MTERTARSEQVVSRNRFAARNPAKRLVGSVVRPDSGVTPALDGGPWEQVLDVFLAANVDSNNTRQAYRRHLRAAFGFFRVRTVAEVTGAMLTGYRARLMDDGRGDACHAQAVSALRSFLRWSRALGAHGLRSEVIEAALKMPRARIRRPYRTIGDGDGKRLLTAAGTARNRAIVGLLLGAGLRVAEVSAVDVGDVIDAEGGPAIYVRRGKGRRDRTVPLGWDVARLVKSYLVETDRGRGSRGPCFLVQDRGAESRGGGRLSARSVGIMLGHLADRAGLGEKGISPHALRHSFAIRALRGGADVVAVSKLLGHASIATTQRYCDHLGLEELRTAVARLT
jgi:site-specific recombinase XerD